MISVVIVSYNVKYYLAQCVLSVERSLLAAGAEIIVVDNASADGSADYIESQFPKVRLIRNKENLGFARANNLAAGEAKGEYLLFLNPDTIVSEHTLGECVAFMDSNPKAGAIGVRMCNSDGSFAPESRRSLPTLSVSFCKMTGLCRLFPKSKNLGRYYLGYLDKREINRIEVVSGAYMMVRKDVFHSIGGFDQAFFMYGEDIDISYRILQTGYQNWYLPALIIHYKGESTVKTSYRYVKTFYDAMLIFYNKHYRHYSVILSAVVYLVVLVQAAVSFLKNNIFSSRNTRALISKENKNFIVLGAPETMERVRLLLEKYYPDGKHKFVEGNQVSLVKGHADMDIDFSIFHYVVYDVDSFSFKCMIEAISLTAGNNLRLATFSLLTGVLITEQEVLI